MRENTVRQCVPDSHETVSRNPGAIQRRHQVLVIPPDTAQMTLQAARAELMAALLLTDISHAQDAQQLG